MSQLQLTVPCSADDQGGSRQLARTDNNDRGVLISAMSHAPGEPEALLVPASWPEVNRNGS